MTWDERPSRSAAPRLVGVAAKRRGRNPKVVHTSDLGRERASQAGRTSRPSIAAHSRKMGHRRPAKDQRIYLNKNLERVPMVSGRAPDLAQSDSDNLSE